MQEIWIDYLNAIDAKALALSNDEILDAVTKALDAQGRGETVIEPRVHLVPESSDKGHFNVLRGYVKPLDYAGVKVVGDFVDNYKQGLPSEMAVLNLFDPRTGVPKAVIDATVLLGRLTKPDIRPVGIAINTAALDEPGARRALSEAEAAHGLPAVDPIRTGVGPIVDRIASIFGAWRTGLAGAAPSAWIEKPDIATKCTGRFTSRSVLPSPSIAGDARSTPKRFAAFSMSGDVSWPPSSRARSAFFHKPRNCAPTRSTRMGFVPPMATFSLVG